VLERIFGPKRDKLRVGWRKLDNEELHNLYSSPNITVINSRRGRACKHECGQRDEICLRNFGIIRE
jgi:hypothetical protein